MAAIGVLTLEIRIDTAHSLKDKRHVVKSLKDRLRRQFNVSVAEVAHQDLWQRSEIAVVTVASDHLPAEQTLQSAEQAAYGLLGPQLVAAHVEWL